MYICVSFLGTSKFSYQNEHSRMHNSTKTQLKMWPISLEELGLVASQIKDICRSVNNLFIIFLSNMCTVFSWYIYVTWFSISWLKLARIDNTFYKEMLWCRVCIPIACILRRALLHHTLLRATPILFNKSSRIEECKAYASWDRMISGLRSSQLLWQSIDTSRRYIIII